MNIPDWIIQTIGIQIILALIPFMWRSIKYPVRFIWFLIYNYIRHSEFTPLWRNCKIIFQNIDECQDYINRWKIFVIKGDYKLSEFEKRHVWCRLHRTWESHTNLE